MASRSLALSCGKLLQDRAAKLLQFAEARQVILEIVVQELRLGRVELRSQNHVARLYGVRKKRVFLQLFHGQGRLVLQSPAAVAAPGMNSYRAIFAAMPIRPFSVVSTRTIFPWHRMLPSPDCVTC